MLRLLPSFILFLFISFSALAQDTLTSTIYFAFNKTNLSPKAQSSLDSLVALTARREVVYLSVEGHCDPVGNTAINQRISEERAQRTLIHLNSKGVKGHFQSSLGQGKRNLFVEAGTKGFPDLNRRVEITIGLREIPTPSPKEVVQEEPPIEETQIEPAETGKETPLFDEAELEVGKILVLKDINFFGGTPNILPESEASLLSLLKLLKANPALQIEIRGHVCCTSDMPLSKNRAKTIYRYLIKNGISQSRLHYNGYNQEYPVASDETESGRKANRRVDIKVIAR